MHKPTFPKELALLPNWLDWRLGPDKKTGRDMKVPYNPKTGYGFFFVLLMKCNLSGFFP